VCLEAGKTRFQAQNEESKPQRSRLKRRKNQLPGKGKTGVSSFSAACIAIITHFTNNVDLFMRVYIGLSLFTGESAAPDMQSTGKPGD